MPAYLYRAARADGTTLEGQAEGEDEQAVRAELEKQGILVFRLRPLGAWPALMGSGLWRRKRGIPLQEFLVFNQELLALVKAGLPILRIFDLLIERARRPAFQAVLRAVRQDIRGGTAMSDALARHPLFFPELYIASLKAGEQAGNLPEVLQRYIAYLKLVMGLHQKMTKALAYPAFLVIVGVAVVGFLLTYVLPTFSALYEGDLDQRLSQLTTGIEPVLLLVMGLVGGAIVIIMYLPVFEMAGTVK